MVVPEALTVDGYRLHCDVTSVSTVLDPSTAIMKFVSPYS